MKTDNCSYVLSNFVKELQIPITRLSITEELEKHPDYPSLFAISDVLNNWGVPNAAYELALEELVATEIAMPFIAHLSSGFVIINEINETQVVVSNERWNKHKISKEDFKKYYTGSLLIAEKEITSGEPGYKAVLRKEIMNNLHIPIVVAGTTMIFAVLLLNSNYLVIFNWHIALLTVCKTAGLATSIMLLIQSVDSNNPLIQKLCGGDNNKDCNAILSSKAAKISEELSWSEVGFFYFAGSWLSLLFNSSHLSLLQVLALLNLLSLPYTFYSIYHQWRVAKQWCVFCCTIQGLLWLEFFAFFPYLQYNLQMPSPFEWERLIVCLSAPVIAWIFIKPYLQLSKQMAPLKQQLAKFKYNSALFNMLLKEKIQYSLLDEKNSLVLGNPEAEHIITMVSNPYCQPCSKAHKSLAEWLPNRENVKLQIVFSSNNDENDRKTKVAAHLMALQVYGNKTSLNQAMNDWYEQKQKDYDEWSYKHPVLEKISIRDALNAQREWCKMTDITSTPTIFINGRKLPGNYRAEDIKYFI